MTMTTTELHEILDEGRTGEVTPEMRADPSVIHWPVPTAQTRWAQLDEWLGDGDERPLRQRNTRIRRIHPGSMFGPIAVRYHRTDVVTAYVDGSVVLDSGGWLTMTTKERMNDWLPHFRPDDSTSVFCRLGADKGTWRLSRMVIRADFPWNHDYAHLHETEGDFYDGVRIAANGTVIDRQFHDGDRDAGWKRRIKDYVAGYDDAHIARLIEDARAHGTGGDCWFCSMVTDDGVSLGDAQGDDDHIRDHVIHGVRSASILLNAVRARHYGDPGAVLAMAADGGWYAERVREDLRRYLTQKLCKHTSGAKPTGAIEKGWMA